MTSFCTLLNSGIILLLIGAQLLIVLACHIMEILNFYNLHFLTNSFSPVESLTYRELDSLTDKLAQYLLLHNVQPDTCVGIYMEKCVEYVISYIAILKAGGAYLPLDAAYPGGLLHDILLDSAPRFILSKKNFIVRMDSMQDQTLDMSTDWVAKVDLELSSHSSFLNPSLNLDNLAYTVYSSGTTGKPKGIQCPHRGAVFSYTWRHENYPYSEEDCREACNVFFVWELFRPLCKGATLYVIPDDVIYDPPKMSKFIKNNNISRQLYTPSLFETMIESNLPDLKECFASMRQVWFCGEVVTMTLLERSLKLFPWIQFVNLYSVSECHDVTVCDLSQFYRSPEADLTRKFCPVGNLLPGVGLAILGDDLSMKPVGAPGEIYVYGPTLAKGYLNRADLTQQRFPVPPPGLLSCDRMYKSGDWGYLLSGSGTETQLEICGRCDSMVKIRGYSIEIQAVEAALLEMTCVSSCVVLVMGDEGDDKFLVAYIVPEDVQTKTREIRAQLKTRLPFYMIPSYFVLIQSIPVLASSGKLDKKALPPYITPGEDAMNHSAASTNTERQLLPIWADLLNLKHFDVQDSFFDLGGHSLLAAKLLGKIQESFGVTLSVQNLFSQPSLAGMGQLIDAVLQGQSADMQVQPQEVDLVAEVDRHNQASLISMDMQLRAFWRMFQYRMNWDTASVLLTGSTGFLGAFILRELILTTKTHIHCIVRDPGSTKSPKDKLMDNLRMYKIISPGDSQACTEEMIESRVSVITGDISLVRMGLSEEDHSYLLTEIDYVIHAAAHVNLIFPYQALYPSNVIGTENVILFACAGKIKPIHYISSDAVFPSNVVDGRETDDLLDYASQLSDGYSKSKWVAEQMMRRASQRGLPVAVYRCGNICGDTRTSAWNRQDFILSMVKAFLETESLPDDVNWTIEMTPVDFISQAIVRMSQTTNIAFGKVFHLIQPKPLHLRSLADILGQLSYRIKPVSLESWLDKLSIASSQSQQLVHLPFMNRAGLEETRTFNNSNILQILPELGLQYPVLASSLITHYLRGLSQDQTIPKPPISMYPNLPLKDKVVVVTGASSGIGAAISHHCAAAGAKVAMGARREEKLKEIRDSLVNEGKHVRYTLCDVTKPEQVKALVSETELEYGQPVDVIVNNAGVMFYTDMIKQHAQEWESQIDINCKGVVNGVAAVLDSMTNRKSGHIINMSSDAGKRGFAGLAVYSGTKFFVEGFSQALRHEMVEHGVKVTCIQPGDVQTELLGHTTDAEAKNRYACSDMSTVMQPDDIGKAVVYIASQPKNVAINEMLIEPASAPI